MDHTIRFIRGDTYVVNLSVTDADGNLYIPRMSDILTMTVRLKDYKGEIVIQKKTGDADVVITDTGWKIIIQPADTSELLYRAYVYDIELNMLGVVKTVIPLNKFILDKEVTY